MKAEQNKTTTGVFSFSLSSAVFATCQGEELSMTIDNRKRDTTFRLLERLFAPFSGTSVSCDGLLGVC